MNPLFLIEIAAYTVKTLWQYAFDRPVYTRRQADLRRAINTLNELQVRQHAELEAARTDIVERWQDDCLVRDRYIVISHR